MDDKSLYYKYLASCFMLGLALAFGFWLPAACFLLSLLIIFFLMMTNERTTMIQFEVDYFGCDEDTYDSNIALVALDFLTDEYKAYEQREQALDYLDRYIRSGL